MLREYVKPFAGVISIKLNETVAGNSGGGGTGHSVTTGGFSTLSGDGDCIEYLQTTGINIQVALDTVGATDINKLGTVLPVYYMSQGYNYMEAYSLADNALATCPA